MGVCVCVLLILMYTAWVNIQSWPTTMLTVGTNMLWLCNNYITELKYHL